MPIVYVHVFGYTYIYMSDIYIVQYLRVSK